MQLKFTLPLLLLLTSCMPSFSVRTEYYNVERLASMHVGSPDPRRNEPIYGEKWIVFWSLPIDVYKKRPLFLQYTLIFKDKSKESGCIPILKRRDLYTFSLTSDLFFQKGGILSYTAQIVDAQGCVLEQRTHLLYKELIEWDNEEDDDKITGDFSLNP